jgi:hypothetical protein
LDEFVGAFAVFAFIIVALPPEDMITLSLCFTLWFELMLDFVCISLLCCLVPGWKVFFGSAFFPISAGLAKMVLCTVLESFTFTATGGPALSNTELLVIFDFPT